MFCFGLTCKFDNVNTLTSREVILSCRCDTALKGCPAYLASSCWVDVQWYNRLQAACRHTLLLHTPSSIENVIENYYEHVISDLKNVMYLGEKFSVRLRFQLILADFRNVRALPY